MEFSGVFRAGHNNCLSDRRQEKLVRFGVCARTP